MPTETAPKAVEYKPAPHFVQSAAVDNPIPVKKVPAAQLLHVSTETAPKAVEYRPAVHKVHKEAEVKPMPVKYEPAAHLRHAVAAAAEE